MKAKFVGYYKDIGGCRIPYNPHLTKSVLAPTTLDGTFLQSVYRGPILVLPYDPDTSVTTLLKGLMFKDTKSV